MQKGTAILLLGAGVLAYSLFRKKTGLSNLKFYPKKIKDLRFDGVTPVLVLGLAVQNTGNQSFTLKSMAGEVFANNYQIGNISTFTPQTIYPNAETVVYADARLSLLGIVSDILNAITNGTFSQKLELSFMANVDNLQFPIELDFKFGN